MKISLLSLLLSLLTISFQTEGSCRLVGMEDLNTNIKHLKELYFPNLKDIQLEVRSFKSKNYYLKTNINVGTILNRPDKRHYYIEINPKMLDCAPPENALDAILVHELKHIEDMVQMKTGALLGFLIKYGTNKKFIISYERETDERPLELGLAEGLKEYRRWIYSMLDEKGRAEKRKIYYTPEEIDLWVDAHNH